MLDSLAGFPRLSLAAEITGKILSKGRNNPRVKIKAHLGYKNTKTPTWNGAKPSLTFIAESSSGNLVHFWRGNVQKLTQGQELKFDADVDSSDDEIRCQFACDDIVGSVVSFKLMPNLSTSDFPPPKPGKQALPLAKPSTNAADSDEDDEFGDAGFADEEIIAAVKTVETAPQSDYGSDDFADIDDLDNVFGHNGSKKSKEDDTLEVVKMDNGKWACNHACRGGQPLKHGQLCKHRCCHEGLDKPRKMKRKASAHIEQRVRHLIGIQHSKGFSELSGSANQVCNCVLLEIWQGSELKLFALEV